MKQPLLKLLGWYRDVIALPRERLGVTTYIKHHIKLKPVTQHIYVPAYGRPHSQRQIVEEHIKDMEAQGVIQDQFRHGNYQSFFFLKKNGSFQEKIDFRSVNEVTQNEKYQLPIFKDLLMSFRSRLYCVQ